MGLFVAKKKLPIKKRKRVKKIPSWAAVGFDTSLSSIAGAAIAWDSTLGKMVGPVFTERRWMTSVDYFIRLKDAVNSPVLVQELMGKLLLPLEMNQIWICQEAPVHMGGKMGAWIKQQCEISGAFLGGLVKWGYPNIEQVNNKTWKKMVAEDLGISQSDPEFKFLVKEWAMEEYAGVPDWPNLIRKEGVGLIPKPESSRAKGVQPDDRYD